MQVLAPVGRMALTNYLLESVVSTWLYNGWGLGLVGRLPPSRSLALSLTIFALQVGFSHVWLSRFRFGPWCAGCGARSPTAERSPCVWRPGAPRIRR